MPHCEPRLSALLLLILLPVLALGAEGLSVTLELAPDTDGPAIDPSLSGELYQAFATALSAAWTNPAPLAVIIPGEDGSVATAQARVVLAFRPAGTRISLLARLEDPRDGTLLAAEARSAPGGLLLLDQLGDLAGAMARDLETHMPFLASDRSAGPPRFSMEGTVLRGSQEGVKVSLADGTPLGEIRDGVLVIGIPLARDKDIALRLEKPGFHPDVMHIQPSLPAREFRLPELVASAQWAAGIVLDPLVPLSLGADFRWMPIPDQAWVGGGLAVKFPAIQLFADGYYSYSDSSFNTDVLVSPGLWPYACLSAEAGWFLGNPGDAFRPFLQVGTAWYASITQSGSFPNSFALRFPCFGIQWQAGPWSVDILFGSEYIIPGDNSLITGGTVRFLSPMAIRGRYRW